MSEDRDVILVQSEDGYILSRGSSKGNQRKWHVEDQWYKADYMGYESLAEFIVSSTMKESNENWIVPYEMCRISEGEHQYVGCVSSHFLYEFEELISWEHLFRNSYGMSLSQAVAKYEECKDRVRFAVQEVERITKLSGVGEYLTRVLEMDAVFLNEDRHFNNLAVVYHHKNKKFRLAPAFDHGAALFSDIRMDYPEKLTIDECYKRIEAKPFVREFDEQVDMAEELYGVPLKIHSDIQRILFHLQKCERFYDKTILSRVEIVLRRQVKKYGYLFANKYSADRKK